MFEKNKYIQYLKYILKPFKGKTFPQLGYVI